MTGFDKEMVQSMQSRTKTCYKKGYTAEVKIANLAKLEHERRNKVMPEQILQFEASPIVCHIIKVIKALSAQQEFEITQSIYTGIQDLIFTEVFINNGHQTEVPANMTLKLEFDNKKEIDAGYCFTVVKHKEAKAGPIRIYADQELYGWMKIYRENVRPTVTTDTGKSSIFFLSWYGNRFQKSGGISNTSTSLGRKTEMTGMEGGNKLCKAANTATREGNQFPTHFTTIWSI